MQKHLDEDDGFLTAPKTYKSRPICWSTSKIIKKIDKSKNVDRNGKQIHHEPPKFAVRKPKDGRPWVDTLIQSTSKNF